MTLRKFNQLYDHYKNYYDFEKTGRTFKELDEASMKEEEWLP